MLILRVLLYMKFIPVLSFPGVNAPGFPDPSGPIYGYIDGQALAVLGQLPVPGDFYTQHALRPVYSGVFYDVDSLPVGRSLRSTPGSHDFNSLRGRRLIVRIFTVEYELILYLLVTLRASRNLHLQLDLVARLPDDHGLLHALR
jgi:hypothetical protein